MTVNETQWKVENECEITWKQFLMWDLRRAHGLKLKTSQANWQNATRDAKSRSRRRGRGSAMEWGVCLWLPQLQLQLKLASYYLDSAAGLSSKTHELTLCVRVCECVCLCVESGKGGNWHGCFLLLVDAWGQSNENNAKLQLKHKDYERIRF